MTTNGIVDEDFVTLREGDGAPAISFLMPVFQQRAFVRAAVESVLAQRDVVVEVILSDDASTDRTFDCARQAVADWLGANRCPHRIVLRRGRSRLRRDHLALLVDHASCDLVCQAHGDDESHPDRARLLVDVFRAYPKVTMAASEALTIDAGGQALDAPMPVPSPVHASRYDLQVILEGHPFLIGFSQAWRRSAVSAFGRLDSTVAAVSHDRILPLRAALAGDVVLLHAQLVRRRVHETAWTNLMFDEPDESGGYFGWSLARLCALATMDEDVQQAGRLRLIGEDAQRDLTRRIDVLRELNTENMLEAMRVLTRSGRQIVWADEEALLDLRRRRQS